MTIHRILVVAVSATVLLAACGDDDADPTTTTSPLTTTPTTMATTTVPVTTTTVPVTTTTTTTTTTTMPTTTTIEDLVLAPGGIGAARLGDDPDQVIAYVIAALGEPGSDSGWEPHPLFEHSEFRSVLFGDGLWLAFGTDESPYGAEGTPHFQSYGYYGSPTGLTTATGVTVGTTVSELLAAYGTELELVQESIANEYRYQLQPADTNDFLCFLLGYDVPSNATPAYSITAGISCAFGGE